MEARKWRHGGPTTRSKALLARQVAYRIPTTSWSFIRGKRRLASWRREPTSRCQIFPSTWTLGEDQFVIPRVTFIRWASTFPLSTVRLLRPTFVPAWRVAVKLPSAFALKDGYIAYKKKEWMFCCSCTSVLWFDNSKGNRFDIKWISVP